MYRISRIKNREVVQTITHALKRMLCTVSLEGTRILPPRTLAPKYPRTSREIRKQRRVVRRLQCQVDKHLSSPIVAEVLIVVPHGFEGIGQQFGRLSYQAIFSQSHPSPQCRSVITTTDLGRQPVQLHRHAVRHRDTWYGRLVLQMIPVGLADGGLSKPSDRQKTRLIRNRV